VALKRGLALLAVAALIVAALQIRAAREGPGDGPLAGGDATEPSAPGDGPAGDPGDVSGALTLGCADVLEPVCAELAPILREDGFDVRVATPTAAAGGPPVERGALLTLAPLAALAVPAGAAEAEVAVLARSPLVAAVWDDRAEVLLEHCGGTLTWRCVGEAAGGEGTWTAIGGPAPWGPVKPGHADPTASEAGALVLGHLAASYFGRADVSRQDLDDVGFFAWFTDLEQAVPSFRPSSGSPLLAMIQFGPASFDVVGVVEAEAVSLLARAADRTGSTLRLRPVEPIATADVQVTAVGSDGAVQDVVEAVTERAPALLARAGWRVEGQAPEGALAQVGVQQLGALPASTGLPSAGALDALRRTWSEVAR
jgi:hypothetical protein